MAHGDITINVKTLDNTTHQLQLAHDAPVPLIKARDHATLPCAAARPCRRALRAPRLSSPRSRRRLPWRPRAPRAQERLAERTGVDASRQRLIYRGRVLRDPEARRASRARRRAARARLSLSLWFSRSRATRG